jgi:hypothetical protein
MDKEETMLHDIAEVKECGVSQYVVLLRISTTATTENYQLLSLFDRRKEQVANQDQQTG